MSVGEALEVESISLIFNGRTAKEEGRRGEKDENEEKEEGGG